MYLHLDLFAFESLKQGAHERLILRAQIVSSNSYLLEKETKHLENVFLKVNGYPTWVVRQIAQKVVM